MDKWKTLKTEYIHKGPFGNIRKDKCKLPNGIVIDDYYVNEYSDWVNAVIITKDKQLVLVEQYRHGGKEFFLEVPAGKKESHESDIDSIIREVREETGFTSLKPPVFLGEFMVNPARQNNKIKTYLLLDAFKAYELDLDETEEVQVSLYDFYRFEDLLLTGNVNTQLFTVAAYLLAKNYMQGLT